MTDQLTANVFIVNPDGTVSAELTGHLAAQGVDLDASTFSTPPADDQVRWLRPSDGQVVGTIGAITGPLSIQGEILLEAADPDDPTKLALLAIAILNTGDQRVVAQAGTHQVLLADSAGPPAVTGSRGGNTALASLLTTLATLGLIHDGTTP